MRKVRLCNAALAAVILFAAGYGALASSGSQPWASTPGLASNPDMRYAYSAKHNIPGQYDRNGDGKVDLMVVDRNGDGIGDYWATDRSFNGAFDDYQYDRNFNGKIDQWEYDLNGNGVSDLIYVDTTGDGNPDLTGKLNPLTRTYTWYGDMKSVQARSSSLKMPSSIRPSRPLARGKAAFSD